MPDCLPFYLIMCLGLVNFIVALVQRWPTVYQVMNIPQFILYTVLIYFMCEREHVSYAWAFFALIALGSLFFMIGYRRIFALQSSFVREFAPTYNGNRPNYGGGYNNYGGGYNNYGPQYGPNANGRACPGGYRWNGDGCVPNY